MLTASQRDTITKVKQAIESFENTADPFFLSDLGVLIHILWEEYDLGQKEDAEHSEAGMH